MSKKLSKTKKKVAQRVKNAIQRSTTVWLQKKPDGYIDEAEYFANTGQLYPPGLGDATEGTIGVYPSVSPKVEEVYHGPIVYLDREDRDSPPFAVCSAGDFKTETDTNLLALGRAAREHAEESGHRLRSHDDS